MIKTKSLHSNLPRWSIGWKGWKGSPSTRGKASCSPFPWLLFRIFLLPQPSFLGCFPQAFPVPSRLFRERFADHDTVLESQTRPNQALKDPRLQPLHPMPTSRGENRRDDARGGPPMSPEQEKTPSVLGKRAQRPINKPFYLSTCKRKGTGSGVWLTLSHPPPTSNNRVSPRIPQERSTWKQLLIAQLLRAADGGFGFGQHGSVEIAINPTKMSRETGADCWPTNLVSCLHGGCKKKIKPYLMFSCCHRERGYQGEDVSVVVLGMTPWAMAEFCT